MKTKRTLNSGFTLVEMLVVIVVIVVLMSIVFKLNGKAADAANRAKTVHDLEKISAALAEFHAQYGIYPPCKGTRYVTLKWSKDDNGKVQQGFDDSILEEIGESYSPEYGLVSYLCGVHSYNFGTSGAGAGVMEKSKSLTEEDEEFLKIVAPYIEGVRGEDFEVAKTSSGKVYTNDVYYFLDGWDHEFYYKSKPPYSSYELYSFGPDGKGGTRDDIHGGMGDI